MFHDIEGTKNTMLKADPSLERRMTIQQGIGRRLTPCSKFYHEKKVSTLQTTLDTFLTKKTLSVSMFLMFYN